MVGGGRVPGWVVVGQLNFLFIFLTDNGIEENLKVTMTDLKAAMESEFSKVNSATQKLKGN